jgi:alpha-1,6-mannosyltransferase
MMVIKTLHLTNAWHESSGGIRTFYRAMLAAANATQRPMRLVVPSHETRVEEVGAFGRIYHVRAPRSPWVDSRYRLILPPAFLRTSGAVRQILADEQPDLVEVCDKYSLCYLAGLLRRNWMRGVTRPTIVGLSCERLDDNIAASMSNASWARRFAQWYVGQIYAGQFDVHLANSEYTARELRDHMRLQHWREVHVVPMGVDTTDLGPAHRDEALRTDLLWRVGGDAQARLLLYAGRLSQEKNLPLLIDTLAQLDDGRGMPVGKRKRTGQPGRGGAGGARYRLVIAGDGPMAAALRDEASRRTHGRVLFWGHVADRATLARLYATCDAFVHPNPREPFGIGPLEAMASGLPVVAPRAGGLLSYANDSNAWLAEPAGEAFAAQVRDACLPGNVRGARIAAALSTAAGYGWSSVTRAIFELYDALHARRASLAGQRRDIQHNVVPSISR